VRQYEWWALAHNAMHLSDWTTLFPKTNIEMMTHKQQEFLELLNYYQADGNKVFELGVRPEEIIEDEDEHTQEDEHSQDDDDSQEDEHTPEDEYSSTELQRVQESLNRQHAEISSLKNELREMHELLRNFVMRSTTIDEDQHEVKRVVKSKEIDKHKRVSFQKVTIFYKSKPNWHELSHALRYIAYTKETSSSTDENGYRVLAYAKNYMPLSAWIKLFPATKFTKLTGSISSIVNVMRLKGNHVSEYGERPEQGKRTDLMTSNKTKHA
jgi:hypothetical protein